MRTREIPAGYAALSTYLGERSERPLCNNTRLYRRAEGAVGVVLHSTEIVTLHPDGSAIIRMGGWNSPTTRARINSVLDCGVVFTHKGEPFYSDYYGVGFHGPAIPFAEGMRVGGHGGIPPRWLAIRRTQQWREGHATDGDCDKMGAYTAGGEAYPCYDCERIAHAERLAGLAKESRTLAA